MEESIKYQICSRCVMDTSDPWIDFDENGVCNHCRQYDFDKQYYLFDKDEDKGRMEAIVKDVIAATGSKGYNCIVGLSGGVDSSWMTYQAVKLGLKPLVVHVDCGWNSEIAVKNIENICNLLNLDLITHVVYWEEMRDLQLAFLKSNVANQDIPQDHAIFSALYNYALKNNIHYVLNGSNFASESVLPQAWGYNALDYKHIRAIYKRFGSGRLKQYPHLTFFRRFIYFSYIRKMRIIKLLNYLPYDRENAIKEMENEIGWRYYGGKHHESRFTKFFQSWYLPVKFGYDKRRCHLASLVLAGQISRDAAMEQLKSLPYNEKDINDDIEYVAKKLGIEPDEFRAIISQPNKSYSDYPSNERLFKLGFRLRNKFFR